MKSAHKRTNWYALRIDTLENPLGNNVIPRIKFYSLFNRLFSILIIELRQSIRSEGKKEAVLHSFISFINALRIFTNVGSPIKHDFQAHFEYKTDDFENVNQIWTRQPILENFFLLRSRRIQLQFHFWKLEIAPLSPEIEALGKHLRGWIRFFSLLRTIWKLFKASKFYSRSKTIWDFLYFIIRTMKRWKFFLCWMWIPVCCSVKIGSSVLWACLNAADCWGKRLGKLLWFLSQQMWKLHSFEN